MQQESRQLVAYSRSIGLKVSAERLQAMQAGARWLAHVAHASGLSQYEAPSEALLNAMGPALTYCAFDGFPKRGLLADLGAGNGAIGATIALFAPDLEVYLVDRAERAYTTSELLVARMGLSNAHPLRSEVASLEARYDAVVFRAFARGEAALRTARSVVREAGVIGAYHQESDPAFEQPDPPVTVVGTEKTVVSGLALTLYRR